MTSIVTQPATGCPTDGDAASAVAAARRLRDIQLTEWAQATFPGIIDLRPRTQTLGSAGQEQVIIGDWHGALLAISMLGTEPIAHVAVRCRCCDLYTDDFARGYSPGLRGVADFARAYTTDPHTEVEECFDCAWLHPAQDDARRVTGRFAAWRFRTRRGTSHTAVLARHHRRPR